MNKEFTSDMPLNPPHGHIVQLVLAQRFRELQQQQAANLFQMGFRHAIGLVNAHYMRSEYVNKHIENEELKADLQEAIREAKKWRDEAVMLREQLQATPFDPKTIASHTRRKLKRIVDSKIDSPQVKMEILQEMMLQW